MSHNLRRRPLTASALSDHRRVAPASVFAHVEFEDAPATVAPNTDIALALHVANEGETPDKFNGRSQRLPEGWTGVSCEEKPTWTCEIVEVSERSRSTSTRTRAPRPRGRAFEFTIHSSATWGLQRSRPCRRTTPAGRSAGWAIPDTRSRAGPSRSPTPRPRRRPPSTQRPHYRPAPTDAAATTWRPPPRSRSHDDRRGSGDNHHSATAKTTVETAIISNRRRPRRRTPIRR